MLDWYYRRQIDKGEARLGQSAEWLRDVLASSRAGFRKFGMFMMLANHRAHAPADLWHLCRVAADMVEDCGPCTQIAVDMALQGGVPASVLRAAVDGRLQDLSPRQALAFRFARAVAANTPEAEDLRAALEAEIGKPAMADLAIAIATARVFPAMKRALGHALSCSRVEVRTP
ncbi:hypothetical protein L2U69_00660 [Zavarzinia compransoris]|uniref:hypothetical protein n=1 Tax=Zavarzinia marina TaxID=2911065 RepID=UPI001F38B35F|nr:hypothetical protein [Zavarzinia marina]MCF4164154.1 hypothetical protein [Zavarzinia marina]